MIDKKELVSTYLQQFGSHYQMSRLLNPTLRIDDEFISRFLFNALKFRKRVRFFIKLNAYGQFIRISSLSTIIS